MIQKFKELYCLESINEDIEQNIDFEKFVFCGVNGDFTLLQKFIKIVKKLKT